MKLRPKQIERLVQHAFRQIKEQKLVTFKAGEEKAFQRAVLAVKQNINDEMQLDREVNQMMDDLEKQHAGEFERYKMFPLLKRKMAKEKGFVL